MQLILVINRRTRIEYYANKFSTLISIKPLGLIVHGLCFLGVNVFAIECIQLFQLTLSVQSIKLKDNTESLRGIFMNKLIKSVMPGISSTMTCTCRNDFDEIIHKK